MRNNKTVLGKAREKYSDMLQRCTNPNSCNFENYGMRGIQVLISREDFISWYVSEYPKYFERTGIPTASINRLDNDGHDTLENIELLSVAENTKEAYHRRGNPSPYGNKIDDVQALVIHTFKNGYSMGKHYGVAASTANRILRGETHKHIFEVLK